MRDPSKGHSALRKGRWSTQDTLYFITICLRSEQAGLDSVELFESSMKILNALECESCKALHGIVHMPNHIHLLVELNNTVSLQELVRLYKGRMTPEMRKHRLNWQNSYHDRRLRPEDSAGAILRYMLMNPYRKGLSCNDEDWPYWHTTNEAKTWMNMANEENLPIPEWLSK